MQSSCALARHGNSSKQGSSEKHGLVLPAAERAIFCPTAAKYNRAFPVTYRVSLACSGDFCNGALWMRVAQAALDFYVTSISADSPVKGSIML